MPPTDRWVCLDVGETLVDETRFWSTWADLLGVPRLTLHAAVGAGIARGGHDHDAFAILGIDDWRDSVAEVEAVCGALQPADLYPDALPALEALRAAGYGVAVVGNQPARRHAELEVLGVEADVIAMSGELGVAKPDRAFFERVLGLLGDPEPARVAYVGDRTDNDVRPAAAAGLRAVWLRRGPWGTLQDDPGGHAALTVSSLRELVARLPEAFARP